jgi:hypothetical protein
MEHAKLARGRPAKTEKAARIIVAKEQTYFIILQEGIL